MHSKPGNDLNLGPIAGSNAMLGFSRTERDKHLYVCGTTGMGKSKFLEHLIQQDILAWRRSRCGLILLDPHGNLYDNLIRWMAWLKLDRPIIPIDLRQTDWIVAYNLLRHRQADPAVLVDNITDAMAYVWGQGGTNQTPLFARWIGNILNVLHEKGYTLVEAKYLISHIERRLQQAMTAGLADAPSQEDWLFAQSLSPKDFESQIGSTVNRLQRFIKNQTMRSMFGLSKVSLDLGAALEDGAIVLVNLATEHAKISKTNAELFATVLLSDLWTAAQERGKRDGVKPFYVYLDEFQRFITPTIADNLDEARGYGLHFTLAHQFLNQLLGRGENGKRVYDSVMENASSKVVFRLTAKENLEPLAEWLFRGVMNPDEIKHELYGTKVLGYREELKEVTGESHSSGSSRGTQLGRAFGSGSGSTQNLYESVATDSSSESESSFSSASESESESSSESTTTSKSVVPMLVPVFGKELSHVQFRTLAEQLHRAMAVLFDQKERQGVARLVGMSAPVSLYTPTVNPTPGSEERTKRYLEKIYQKLPFALRGATAQQQIEERERYFKEFFLKEMSGEPTTAKRRLPPTTGGEQK